MILPDDITEDEALNLFHEMKIRFGWAAKVWTRNDANDIYRQALENEHAEECDEAECNADSRAVLTDELWGRVQDSSYWHRSLEECRDHEWDCVSGAVEEALGRDA